MNTLHCQQTFVSGCCTCSCMRYCPPVNADLDFVSGAPRCLVQQMRLSDLGPASNEQQQQQTPAYICSNTNLDVSAYQRPPVLPVHQIHRTCRHALHGLLINRVCKSLPGTRRRLLVWNLLVWTVHLDLSRPSRPSSLSPMIYICVLECGNLSYVTPHR